MIMVYRLIYGYDNVDYTKWFKLYGNDHRVTRTAAYPKNIVPERSHTDVRRNFFSQRVANAWNDLPVNLKDSPTLNIFKSRYDKLLHER